MKPHLFKRSIDFLVAVCALAVLSPLCALIALVIKVDTPGPVLFRQQRHGLNQTTFWMYKFRSMYDAPNQNEFRQVTRNDDRVTPIGRILRRTNLDELPQLLNVLLGDMSLVGPRPHPLPLDQRFEHRLNQYCRRYHVRPGITGWAQVNGFRGETDTLGKMRARLDHDLHYIDNWTVFFDLRILALTLFSPKSFWNAF